GDRVRDNRCPRGGPAEEGATRSGSKRVSEAVPRALIDTNVWISAFINPHGLPARVLGAFLEGRFVPVVSQSLLDEIREVLNRPRIRRRLRLGERDLATVLDLLRDRAVGVVPTGVLRLCRDPGDDFILEAALLAHAQFAVSRDDDLKRDPDLMARLREQGVEVLSVAQFLERLEQSQV
ncbi:MAG: putative toxin-antitoxin system toxin component, PIN family, partial [Dehalococcoidia bacterium]|nr:putative toxin-antitoxin system toxin component, PIN family [Dehalococcoidia bacterium]